VIEPRYTSKKLYVPSTLAFCAVSDACYWHILGRAHTLICFWLLLCHFIGRRILSLSSPLGLTTVTFSLLLGLGIYLVSSRFYTQDAVGFSVY
jgi:hypothetical protein